MNEFLVVGKILYCGIWYYYSDPLPPLMMYLLCQQVGLLWHGGCDEPDERLCKLTV
jgi:hypothetical protein